MSSERENLTKLLNASGFAFQLALEQAVRSAPMEEPWRIEAREYPWASPTKRGYIDLILRRGNIYLVIECKRSRDAVWVFLMPDDKQMHRSHARIRWADMVPHRKNLAGWGDIQVEPASPETDFCVVRGQGESDLSLLERIAGTVAEAAEHLSADLLELGKGSRRTNVVIPVIVTTADLTLSRFNPADVNLKSGEVGTAAFEAVPHVRFRKSLASVARPDEYEPEKLSDLSAASERTVFVVGAVHFTSWLDNFEIRDTSRPWESARNYADAMGV